MKEREGDTDERREVDQPNCEGENSRESKTPIPLWERTIVAVPSTSLWPAQVPCNMNIPVWAELMRASGLEREIPYITEGFKSGFCLGIPQHDIQGLRWYTPDNHKSALGAREQIEKTLLKERGSGRVKGPFTHEEVYSRYGFFRTNPMGGAVNGDGTIRMVDDLSHPRNEKDIPSVNSFVNKLNYGTYWDDFDTVAQFFQENPGEWEAEIFNWQKAYRQLPGHPSERASYASKILMATYG